MRNDVDLDRLIPHRPPMRLVEGIAAVDEACIECVCSVRPTWPTVEEGCVRSLVLLEVLAQTAAVLQEWKEQHLKAIGEGGLLVGIPEAMLAAPTLPVGTALTCRVRAAHGVSSYRVFEGEVRDQQGRLWVKASIQAFRPQPAHNPIKLGTRP